MIHLNPSWDTKILGCLFKDSGYDAFKHTIYINNEAGGHEASNIEIAWNELDNVIGDLGSYDGMPAINIRNAHSSLQVHDLYIHDNLMKNSPSGTFFWSESYNYNVYIWNNINYNVAHTCTGSVLGNILFWAGRDLYIWNNVFYNVGNVSRGISMIRLSGSANVQSANNIFYSVDNQQYIRSYGTFVSTNDIYYGNDLSSGSGINTINPLRVDPRFVSISGPDFHLQPTSPAIDAGVPAVSSIVTKDYDGNPRPMDGDDDGSAEYDIGAYEYTSGYIPPLGAPSVIGITPTNDTTPSWTWSSGGGGNGTYRYKLDNSDLSSGATQTFNTTYTPDTVLSEGPHTLYVQERDGAGNWSSSGSFTIVIDTTEPSTPVITTDGGNGPGADYSTTDSSITLEGSCTGDTVTIYVNGSTDGIAYTSGETSWTYTGILESGENTFKHNCRRCSR
jgi:hypothetical protein